MREDKLHRMEIKITRTDSVRDVAKVNKQHLKQPDINKSSSFYIFFFIVTSENCHSASSNGFQSLTGPHLCVTLSIFLLRVS